MIDDLRLDSTGIYQSGGSCQISKRPETRPTLPKILPDSGSQTLGSGKVYHGQGIGKG